MNIFIHQDYLKEQLARIKRSQRIGTILVVISVFVSIASFTAIQYNFLLFVVYPPALIGLTLWQLSKSSQRNLERAPRADALLNAELKGLNNKYSLHHYIKYGETWIHHLLITPEGAIVMVSNDTVGPVTCSGGPKGDRWKSPTNLLDRWSGLKPPVGNPSQELAASVAATHELLGKVGKPEVPVKGLVLFTRNPDIQIDGCSFQGVPMNEGKLAIREVQQEFESEREDRSDIKTILTSDDRRRLNTFLAPEVVTLPTAAVPAKR
jgi:hypothetical protein